MHVIIVGSGVSGLLLGEALLASGAVQGMTVISSEPARRARFLSFWTDGATPFDAQVVAKYQQVRIIDAAGIPITASLERLEYRTVDAGAWLDMKSKQLRDSGRCEFVEAEVTKVTSEMHSVTVHARGGALRADWAFVSGDTGASPDFYQYFRGWEIELAEDLALQHSSIALDAATLMDFRASQSGDFRFNYVLPLGPRRLFVEHVSHQPADHDVDLQRYLTEVLKVGKYEVQSRESGCTPLYRKKPQRAFGRVIGIGVRAGLAKFCTGYALMHMWRDAHALAHGIGAHGTPTVHEPTPSLSAVADYFFADALRTQPAVLLRMLPELFRHAPGDAVMAFLDDTATLRQQASVARAMPGWVRWLFRGGLEPQTD